MKDAKVNRFQAVKAGCRERLAREDAFSIAELLVGIMLLFVLTYAAFNFSQTGVSLTRTTMYNAEINQEWRQAMDKMTWQMRVAHYFVPGGCVPGGSSVSFYAYADATQTRLITFTLNGTELQVSQAEGEAAETIVTDVESLAFSYYDADGKIITAYETGEDGVVDTTVIERVEINMTITRGYQIAVGSGSEGHRMYESDQYVTTSGTESVSIRNQLAVYP